MVYATVSINGCQPVRFEETSEPDAKSGNCFGLYKSNLITAPYMKAFVTKS